MKWGLIGFVGLIVLGAIAGGGSSTSTTQDDESASPSAVVEQPTKQDSQESAPAAEPKAAAEPKPVCNSKATDDCTPRVSMDQSVRVDALHWNVTGVETASTLGDMEYGLGEKADGTFVVVNLKVRSSKDESATLTDEAVQLETADGNTYKADSDGTFAAIGEGEDPLLFEDIGPDVTMTSKVVFDVPDSALNKKLSVRFGELGFGTTHGYIKLSGLSA